MGRYLGNTPKVPNHILVKKCDFSCFILEVWQGIRANLFWVSLQTVGGTKEILGTDWGWTLIPLCRATPTWSDPSLGPHIHRLLSRLLDGLHGVVTGAAVPVGYQWLGNICQGKIDLSLYMYRIKNNHIIYTKIMHINQIHKKHMGMNIRSTSS